MEAKSDSGKVVLNIPDSNLYKAEITDEYNASKSSFVRQVLVDGVVTEAELVESRSRYMTCVEEAGLNIEIEASGEQREISPMEGRQLSSEYIDDALDDCGSSSGFDGILFVYANLKENPDRKNPVEMMLKCLKKRGVVEAGLTLKEFDPMYEDGDYMDAHRKDFDECYADPNFYNQ